MAGTDTWREGFGRLRAYADGCGDLNVTRHSLSVPPERRETFYGIMQQCQKALAFWALGSYGQKGEELARRCRQMKKRLTGGTNLKEFRLASTLENFMEEPELTMAKPAFGIILDGLQQGLSLEEMEERTKKQVVPFCKDLLRNAYEAWLYYGVVAALEPVRFYGVYSPDTVEVRAVDTETIVAGFQTTSLERRMPEAVFVTRDSRVFAIKSEVAQELDFYGIRPGRCRDFSAGGNTVDQIAHRVLLVYQLKSVEHVPLLADRGKLRLLPSDLMCEFLLPEEMERLLPAAQFAGRIKTVRSRRPVQVMTYDRKGAFPDKIMDDPLMAPVKIWKVGKNEETLREIAKMLA